MRAFFERMSTTALLTQVFCSNVPSDNLCIWECSRVLCKRRLVVQTRLHYKRYKYQLRCFLPGA